MNIIKKMALIFIMAVSFSANSTMAFAEQTTNSSASSSNETIEHIEKALIEINNSDFAAANIHLFAARSSSKQITGDEAIVKQANALLIQGQIQSKQGEIEKATALLNKAIELYKSL